MHSITAKGGDPRDVEITSLVPYAEGMPEALQIVCPHCDMINRISRGASRWGAAELQGACGFLSGQSACEHSIAIHFGLLDMAAEGRRRLARALGLGGGGRR